MPQFMSPGDRRRAVSSAMDTFVPEEGRWQYEALCAICKAQFSVFRTRHHCRYCGMSVCGKHSAHKAVVPVSLSVQEQRVCDQCFPKCVNQENVIASRPRRMTVDARPAYRAANHSKRRHINSTLFIDDDNTVKSTTSSTRSTRKMSLPVSSPSVDDDDVKSVASASTDSTRSTRKMSLPYPYSTSTASSSADERTRSRGSSRAALPPTSSSRGSRRNQAYASENNRSNAAAAALPPRGSARGSLPPKKQVRTMDSDRSTRKVHIPDPPPPRDPSIRSARAMTVGAQPRDPSFAIRRGNTMKPSPIPFREKNTFSDSESDGYSSSDDDMSINDNNSDDSIGDEDDDAFGSSLRIRDSLQKKKQQQLPRTSSSRSTAALVAESPVLLSRRSAQEMQLEFSLSEFSLSGISEAASHVPASPISETRAKNKAAALATIPSYQHEASHDMQLIGANTSLSAKRQPDDDEISSLNDSDAEKPSDTFSRESYWDDDLEYDGNNGIARFSTVSSTLGASALGASAYRPRPSSSIAIAEGDEEEEDGVFRGDRSFAQKTLTHTLSSTGHRLMRTIQELEKQVKQYQDELPTLLAEYERSEAEAIALEQQANESRQRVAQYRKARALVQRAIRSGEKLMLEQEYLAAILELSRAVKIEPKNCRLWYLLAQCRLKVSQYHEAEEACRTCIKLKPSTAAVALLARVLHEQGRHAEAIKWYLTAMGRS